MSGPSFRLQLPPWSMFNFPPDPLPLPIPPSTEVRTFASPFPIPEDIYRAALDWKVPVTIGALYASTAIVMNKINRDRANKPWAITRTRVFHYFVLVHNIFLAIFSALTFVAMIRALAHTWPGLRERPFLGKPWPGLRTEFGLTGAADALCKMHGPRNLGNAVFYESSSHSWMTTNRLVKLSSDGAPVASDEGRLWNEGLAFWGWWFYLSKFYEVLDTFIILMKGKRSSTLQTYHHTGAMACMWAGMRYMSPPIWMFAFLNSGIHAMMYTYYTIAALRIKVPQRIKRTLTTMQISQFLIGITFASLHLFVHYTVPVSTPYTWTKTVSSVVSAASAAVSHAAHEVGSQASAAVESPGIGIFLKQLLLRAIGEAGMAKKLGLDANQKPQFIPQSNVNITETIERETKWRTQYEFIPCIDTEGQAFAIWLNVFYLAPLTLLFARFFVKSYTRFGRASKNSKPSNRISQAAEDAAHNVGREVDSLGKAAENGVGDLASNVLNKINRSGTPKSGDRRRNVSPSIERKVKNFEISDDDTSAVSVEAPMDKKKSQESLRVSVIRKKASEEHNKLRSMFEDGQAFGRSVDHSNTDKIFRTKPNKTESRSRLPSADEEVMEKEKGVEVVETSGNAVAGARKGFEENQGVGGDRGSHENNREEGVPIAQEIRGSQVLSSSNDATKESIDIRRNDSQQTSSANSPNLSLPNDTDANDPFTDPLPSQNPLLPPMPSRSTSDSAVKLMSSIPVLNPSTTASNTSRNASPPRPSKIPKLSRPGSSPKRSTTSPVGSLLSPARTTAIASMDGVNGVSALSGINVATAGGARDRGK